MEAALDEVRKQCANQLAAMAICVTDNPEHWESECHQVKLQLASCADQQ